MSRAAVAFERLAIVLASLALSIGLIALLSGYFAGKDAAGVSGAASTLGQAFPDLGHRHLAAGRPAGLYNSDPPTSGSHHVAAVTRDQVRLSNDQLLTALEAGDVVIAYGPPRPPAGLTALARRLASVFSPALAAAGQAVILMPRSGISGLVALAWTHLLRTRSTDDRTLSQFVSTWLGRGAPSGCC